MKGNCSFRKHLTYLKLATIKNKLETLPCLTITLNSNYSKGTALLQCKLTIELFHHLIPMSDQEGIESPYNINTINSKQTSDENEENVN